MSNTVAISGGFTWLHKGHIALIRGSWQYGDVIVFLNSDDWLKRKYGFVPVCWHDRAEVLRGVAGVKAVHMVDDSDDTVTSSLRLFKPDYFANGGDRNQQTTPEHQVCEELGIIPLYNVGGGKVEGSSVLMKKRPEEQRPWGKFITLDEGEGYKVKKIIVDPGQRSSLQSHGLRTEHMVITTTGSVKCIMPNQPHRIENFTPWPKVIIETQLGICEETDIVRYEDDYGRAGNTDAS